MKAKFFFFLVFGIIFSAALLSSQNKLVWKGKIEYENGIKIIKNPKDPLFGEMIFDILIGTGKMIGLMMVCDFPSRAELEKQWLKNEPYIVGNVWKKIEINRAQIAPFCSREL